MQSPAHATPAWRRARWALVWGAILAVVGWACWPLWLGTRQTPPMMYGGLAGDNIRTPWFYDFVARALADGTPMDRLTDFGWPDATETAAHFPSPVDAVLAAPAAWLFDWPAQWQVTLVLAVLVNAVGMAGAARAAGCGPLGTALAGSLGALYLPAWRDLAMGRMNTALIGPMGLGLWCWARVLVDRPARWSAGRRACHAAGWAVVACVVGGLAAGIYPPFAAMLAPVALLWMIRAGRGADMPARVLAALVPLGAAGVLLALLGDVRPELVAADACRPHCPDSSAPADVLDWWVWRGQRGVNPLEARIAVGSWLLAPVALLLPGAGKRTALLAMSWALALAVVGLGPCPAWSSGDEWYLLPDQTLHQGLAWVWCKTSVVHKVSRFAVAGGLVLVVVSALAVEGPGRRAWRGGRAVGLLLAVLAVAQAAQSVGTELTSPERWSEVPRSGTGAWLSDLPRTPDGQPWVVLELPNSNRHTFLSVLDAPGPRRANPLKQVERSEVLPPALAWFRALADAVEAPPPRPGVSQLRASGIDWVLYDVTRCREGAGRQVEACRQPTEQRLTLALGAPTRPPEAQGLQVWALSERAAEVLASAPPRDEAHPPR